MVEILLIFLVICAISIVCTSKEYRIVILFSVFSLITAAIYLFLGGPDVAMAEAGISAFATIFFIVCIEKHYRRGRETGSEKKNREIKKGFVIKVLLSLLFTVALSVLVIHFTPIEYPYLGLRDEYLRRFMEDVGGGNAVTAIYLGYRVYDTLFEALLLVIAVVAVMHVSWYKEVSVDDGHHSETENSRMAQFTMRIIAPIILIFGVYLVMNGHISAGGGFLGGLAFAALIICRYFVRGIFDLSISKAIKLEELVFLGIVILPTFAIFTIGAYSVWDQSVFLQEAYLISMSALIGLKVAFGFFVLFYRSIAVERL